MAAIDGLAVPLRGQAYRITVPVFDADGDLVTGMTGLDAVVSIDAATAFYTQNNPVEIASGLGLCYLDIAATEMAGNTIAGRIIITNSGAKNTPFVLYTATAIGFDGMVNAIWATPVRALGTAGQTAVSQETTNAVWATGTRTLTQGAYDQLVNQIWATGTRTVTAGTITSVTGNVNVGTTSVIDIASGVWDRTRGSHNASNSFGNLLQSFGVTVATNSDKSNYVLTTGNREEIVSAVWATPTRSLTDWVGIVNAVWATPSRITTSVASPVAVASNYDKVNYTATVASLTEGADILLARNVSGGSSAGRTFKQALHAIRNKVDLLGGVVYDTDDTTVSWTFTVASDTSTDRVISVDPA